MDYTVHAVLQARILEWVAFPFFPADLPDPGIKPGSPALQVDSLPAEIPREALGRNRKVNSKIYMERHWTS